jgi:hypothetical protein
MSRDCLGVPLTCSPPPLEQEPTTDINHIQYRMFINQQCLYEHQIRSMVKECASADCTRTDPLLTEASEVKLQFRERQRSTHVRFPPTPPAASDTLLFGDHWRPLRRHADTAAFLPLPQIVPRTRGRPRVTILSPGRSLRPFDNPFRTSLSSPIIYPYLPTKRMRTQNNDSIMTRGTSAWLGRTKVTHLQISSPARRCCLLAG